MYLKMLLQLKGLLIGFNQGEQANAAHCDIMPWLSLHNVSALALRAVKKESFNTLADLWGLIPVKLNVTFSKNMKVHVHLFSVYNVTCCSVPNKGWTTTDNLYVRSPLSRCSRYDKA